MGGRTTGTWGAGGRSYYFDRLSEGQSWKGGVVSLTGFQIGDDITTKTVTAYPTKVEDFAEPGADLTKRAFHPRELYWAGDGVNGGALSQEPGWKSLIMRISIEGACLDSDGTAQ